MLRKYWQNAVSKLIRKTLSDWHKRRVQPALQRAYTKNGEGFYVNAPKRSTTDSRSLLEYISRYMKRGPIALKNLLMYDGEQVMFHYKDKRTNTKETMTMTVEGFIRALIRHIPDKYFKTIRRYGIYSRRLKSLMEKILKSYQKLVKRLLVNVKKALKPKTWSERIFEEFGINPMECTECGESYECLGMSVRKNGYLHIQYAKDEEARRYMGEENRKIEKEEFQTAYQKAEKAAYEAIRFDWDKQGEIYMSRM
ncbi:transposase [Enterococcus saccharolyticus subsp. saccharolyticus ATCC 43076]|uniref:Transposase n=1 Tax=Enterococcus saccharolyticus subsp. saccharolyticus ATCC 43076 TaxID=1139996 RepID=S0NHF3_9ENTE|nr:transposase [Enterococcus saccharolyticus]EOT27947.1 transposase [Enterococcus saccharolyticus subsp. saccharolyticus ATCC 43076]EOT77325.1 transposase [Enterococcus saccharolyticus subsp. saccharolyticus ATCC 43076]